MLTYTLKVLNIHVFPSATPGTTVAASPNCMARGHNKSYNIMTNHDYVSILMIITFRISGQGNDFGPVCLYVNTLTAVYWWYRHN